MRDVREGESVHEHGLSLEGLHEVGVDGVLQQDHHGSDASEILDCDGLVVVRVRNDHSLEPLPQVRTVLGETEDGRDLRCGCDDESGFVGDSSPDLVPSDSRHDVPQLTDVHVDRLLEHDMGGVDMERVLPDQLVVENG